MTKIMNKEATERLETVRRIITNLHFANRLTREEEARKRELEAEYREITNKYDIVTVYVAKQYKDKWEVIGQADTREEAEELLKQATAYHTDITDVEVCYNK